MAKASQYKLVSDLLDGIQKKSKEFAGNVKKADTALKDGTKTLQQMASEYMKMGDAGKKILDDSGYSLNMNKQVELSMREQTSHVMTLQDGYSKMSSVMKEQAQEADKLKLFSKQRLPFEEEILEAQQNQKNLTSDIEDLQSKLKNSRRADGKFAKGFNQTIEKRLNTMIKEKK